MNWPTNQQLQLASFGLGEIVAQLNDPRFGFPFPRIIIEYQPLLARESQSLITEDRLWLKVQEINIRPEES